VASQSGTAVSLFQPALSDAYSTTLPPEWPGYAALVRVTLLRGQYSFGFTLTGGVFVLNTTPTLSAQLSTSTTSHCTGWTEFFNPNAGANGTDYFFFGMTAECTGAATPGCVVMRTDDDAFTPLTFNVAGGSSGLGGGQRQPTAGQASSIYFTGANGPPNTAFKLTQNGLQ